MKIRPTPPRTREEGESRSVRFGHRRSLRGWAVHQILEKTFHQQAREFRTFSLTVSTKEMEEPRRIRCVDWTNESRLFPGSFQLRTYEKDGETKRVLASNHDPELAWPPGAGTGGGFSVWSPATT